MIPPCRAKFHGLPSPQLPHRRSSNRWCFMVQFSANRQVCISLEGDSHQIFQDTPEESRKHIEMVGRFIKERIK